MPIRKLKLHIGWDFFFSRLRLRFSESTRLGVSRFFNLRKSTRFGLLGCFNFWKSTRLRLLGLCFFLKKYSVAVHSVVFFFKKYSFGFYSVLAFFLSTRLRFTRLLSLLESTRSVWRCRIFFKVAKIWCANLEIMYFLNCERWTLVGSRRLYKKYSVIV